MRARAHTCTRGERAGGRSVRQAGTHAVKSGHLRAPGNSFHTETHAATRRKPSATDAAASVRYTCLPSICAHPQCQPNPAWRPATATCTGLHSQLWNLSTKQSAAKQKPFPIRDKFSASMKCCISSPNHEYQAFWGGNLSKQEHAVKCQLNSKGPIWCHIQSDSRVTAFSREPAYLILCLLPPAKINISFIFLFKPMIFFF